MKNTKTKRFLSLVLTVLMVFAMIPVASVPVSAAFNSTKDINYSYSTSVKTGKIRYIAQQNSSGRTFSNYFFSNYWQGGNAKQGCRAASTSMALSYMGINMTPKTMSEKGINGNNSSTSWNDVAVSSRVASVASSYSNIKITSLFSSGNVTSFTTLDNAIQNFKNGNGTYSPPLVITNDSNDTHTFLVTGKYSDGTYEMIDPISENNRRVKLTSYATDVIYAGNNNGLAIGRLCDVIQYKRTTPVSSTPSQATPTTTYSKGIITRNFAGYEAIVYGMNYEISELNKKLVSIGGKANVFSVNGKDCYVSGHECSNCNLFTICRAIGDYDVIKNTYDGYSCNAFARYICTKVFGTTHGTSDIYSNMGRADSKATYSKLRLGDIFFTGSHWMVYLEATDTGVWVLDGNGDGALSIGFQHYPYSKSYFQNKNVTIAWRFTDSQRATAIAKYSKMMGVGQKPANPSLSLSGSNNIAAGKNITITWSAVSGAEKYVVSLKNTKTNAVCQTKTVTGTRCDFTISEAGTYSVSAYASNKAGISGTANLASSITVHAPCVVKFVNDDGSELSTQKIDYGASAKAPVSPEKEGYLFNGWDKTFDKVTSDLTVTATYRRKSFSVSFYDYAGDKIGNTQTVFWGDSATAPEVNLRSGYTFGGWDTDFSSVKSDLKVSMVDYRWYNDNMLVNLNNATAVRDSDGNGYTVKFNVQNNGEAVTSGRVIVALKTTSGKLLTTTESAAFSLKADASKDYEIFVPYEYAATQVELYAVEKFSTAIPISSKVAVEIDQGTAWTDWSTEKPPADAAFVESRTEYRYADKKTMTGGVSAMDGWTLSDTKLVSTSYGAWQTNQPSTSAKVEGNYYVKKSVGSTPAYRTWSYYTANKNLWWYQKNSGYVGLLQVYSSNTNPPTSGSDNGKAYVDTDKTLTVGSNAKNLGTVYLINDAGTIRNSITAGSSYIPIYKGEKTTLYRQVTQKYQYTLWQWGAWSDWSTTAVSASDSRKIETRTVYRYRTNETTGVENDTGLGRIITGNLGEDYAGKEAILFVYRIESASDYTNEYVGQTVIGDDGSYSFKFKLREEPSVSTGDFSVTLGVEGANTAINLETIEAPLPEYTVTFMDADQKIISTQTVKEGENAVVPTEIPTKPGYYFVGWDTGTTNITNDKVINAVFEAKEYAVVYLDWVNETVQMVEYTYGDEIQNIVIPDTVDKRAIGWDQILLGKTTVTENMILTAQFDTKKYNVNFYDYDNELISSQVVEYGQSAEVPELADKEHYVFLEWSTPGYAFVTENVDVKPVYEFDSTVATPVANLQNKTYSTTQTLKLSCDTEGAKIYYTLDGSNPATSGIEYTAPITISEATAVRFIAKKALCNDSAEAKGYYAINTADMMSKWMLFADLPSYVVSTPAEYSLKSAKGYRYKNIVETSSVEQMEELENSGWTLVESKWSDFSEWSEVNPDTTDKSAELEIREADDIEITVYKYSRWKYFDEEKGEYVSTYAEIDGVDGAWEYTSSVDSLYITSFVDGNPAYSKDGEQWFNQTTGSEYVAAGYQLYRFKYEIKTYYKWTDWTTTAPTSVEKREYETDTVYKYLAPNNYVVKIDYSKSIDSEKLSDYVIVQDNHKLNLAENFFDRDGSQFKALYSDDALTKVWNIDSDVVTKDITLYAAWDVDTFAVRFLDYDGTVLNEQTVEYLSFAELPDEPKRDGYVFIGWENYVDGITSDCDFIAKYVTEEEYTKVELSRSRLSMLTGTTTTISVNVMSAIDSAPELMWYSSNSDIVTVDAYGNLKAVHSGTAIITVVALDTFETDNCAVTVLGTPDAEILSISGSAVKVDPSAKYLLGVQEGANTIPEINKELENADLIYEDMNGNRYTEEDFNRPMGTGVRITLLDGTTVIDQVELVIDGDVNCDGVVDALDAAAIARITAGFSSVQGAMKRAADLCYDDEIDVGDYQAIVNRVIA